MGDMRDDGKGDANNTRRMEKARMNCIRRRTEWLGNEMLGIPRKRCRNGKFRYNPGWWRSGRLGSGNFIADRREKLSRITKQEMARAGMYRNDHRKMGQIKTHPKCAKAPPRQCRKMHRISERRKSRKETNANKNSRTKGIPLRIHRPVKIKIWAILQSGKLSSPHPIYKREKN